MTTKLQIPLEHYERIMAYSKACDVEVHGFGRFDSKSRSVEELYPLFAQEASGVEVETSESTLRALTVSEFSGKMNLHWHSHVDMGVFWSSTDEDCIASIGQSFVASRRGSPFLYSIVVNRKREYKCRLDVFYPIHITLNDIQLETFWNLSESELNKIQKEVRTKVKKKQYAPVQTTPPVHSLQPSNLRSPSTNTGNNTGKTDFLQDAGYKFNYQTNLWEKIKVSDEKQIHIPFSGNW